MEIDKKKLREEYPNLSKELEGEGVEMAAPIEGVRSEETRDLDIIRVIRRCDNEEQVIEIINYMLKRGEIAQEHADNILKQLKENGLRSFGSKVTWGHLEREYR
ncbi:MAG: DUF2095 family protein [Candidatus Freyarchaeum deiterrae]